MKSLKQFFSKGLARGFSMFSQTKRRKHRTRRYKRKSHRRRSMRGG